MEKNFGSHLHAEAIRFSVALSALIVYFGFLALIPVGVLGEKPWGLIVAPLGLILGSVLAWLPRSTLPAPQVFACALGVTIVSLLVLFFNAEPALPDPLSLRFLDKLFYGEPIFTGHLDERLTGCLNATLGSAIFLSPLFVRALRESIRPRRETDR